MGRRKHHEGHGGAWKVAYADFVTAMMALFMVLWISAQQKEILIAASKYFQNPFTSPMPASSGVMEGKKEKVERDENGSPTAIFSPAMYAELAKEFLRLLDVQDKKTAPIGVRVTNEGIVITLFNRANQPIFEPGTTNFTQWGDYSVQNLSWIVDRFHMRVKVDAHSAKNSIVSKDFEDPWELTIAQANAMRRQLVHYGLEASKVDHVSGFSDTTPAPGLLPIDPDNARIEMALTATPETLKAVKEK